MTRRLLVAVMALMLVGATPLLAQFDRVDPPKPVQVKPPAIDPARPVAPPGGGDFPQPGEQPGFPGAPGFPGPGFPQTNYKDVIPPLIELMSDTDKETRESACMALARIGRQAVKPMLEILKDKDKDVELRANAAYVLGQMGPTAQEAVPDLAKALKDSNRDLRRRAAFALSNIIQDESHHFPFGFQGGFPPGAGIIGGAGGFGGPAPVFPGGVERVPPLKPGDPGVLPPVGGKPPVDKPPIEKPPIEKPPIEKKPIEK